MSPCEPAQEPADEGGIRNGQVRVVGLIGEIGGGKSEVAALLRERGAVVIDADVVGHELLNAPDVRDRIVARFGAGVLSSAGDRLGGDAAIDRKTLGAIVFADPSARRDLEAILHPGMRALFRAVIDRESQAENGTGRRLVVLDAAILLEAGWDDLCDLIIFVDAPHEERLRRVEQKRGWSRETLLARERAQWPSQKKKLRADLVITNDADVESLRHQLDRVEAILLGRSSPVVEIANS